MELVKDSPTQPVAQPSRVSVDLTLSDIAEHLARMVFQIEVLYGLHRPGTKWTDVNAIEHAHCRHLAQEFVMALHPPTLSYATNQAWISIVEQCIDEQIGDMEWREPEQRDAINEIITRFQRELTIELAKAFTRRVRNGSALGGVQ